MRRTKATLEVPVSVPLVQTQVADVALPTLMTKPPTGMGLVVVTLPTLLLRSP